MGTPIGLKVNVESLGDNSIIELANELKTYHKGKYVIGRDDVYCEKPHYHIHFWSEKNVSMDTLKQFKSKNLIKKYNLQRTDKIYLGKDLPNSDKLNWEGYAVKENIIEMFNYDDDEKEKIKHFSGVQRDIKKLKKIKSEDLAEKDKVKKQFKDKLFEYIVNEYRTFINENWNELQDCLGYENVYDVPDDNFNVIRFMITKFLMDNDKYGSIRGIFINNYLKEYLGKVKKKSPIFIYNLFVKNT